jgi:hypothetical protein
MQSFITEELIWALNRERQEDARRVRPSRLVRERKDEDPPCNSGPIHWFRVNPRPAGGR